jgi:tRNA G18 (ribose-2'-O)-methylase SpoU
MTSSSSHQSVVSFIAGATVSASLFYAYQKLQSHQPSSSISATSPAPPANVKDDVVPTQASNPSANTAAPDSSQLMDSVELDQRMIRKAEGAILKRTSRLVIVVERCTNDHNYSAILRTAEALGVQHVYIISPKTINSTLVDEAGEQLDADDTNENAKLKRSSGQVVKRATQSEKEDRALHHLFARKATEWLTVHEFDDTKECIETLRSENREIWVTDLSQVASCLTEEGIRGHLQTKSMESFDGKLIPEKVAIVFGTEAVGCTAEMLNAADLRVYLPLRGFADSLNLSVATALVVHQMFVLDPTLAGGMSEDERRELRRSWYAKLASQRLLSSRQKKNKAKLQAAISACETIARKIAAGEHVNEEEYDKWNKMQTKKTELEAIDTKMALDAAKAVEGLVDNPPAPITDMRRADEHRTCFVGKNTKKKHGWDDMAATANLPVKQMATASFFRERANAD